MSAPRRRLAAAGLAALALAAGAPGCVDDEPPAPPRTSMQPAPPAFAIENRAHHTIVELRLAALADRTWEPSLLPAPLPPGARAIAARLPCSHYDVLIVKDDGARCVLTNTALCFDGEPWTIYDVTLEGCVWQP
jgi:hypothetical protein